jgi:hypothetical protein
MELLTDRTTIIALAIAGAYLATAEACCGAGAAYRTIGAFDTMGRLPCLADERHALRRGGVLVQPLTLSDDQPSFPMLPRT